MSLSKYLGLGAKVKILILNLLAVCSITGVLPLGAWPLIIEGKETHAVSSATVSLYPHSWLVVLR